MAIQRREAVAWREAGSSRGLSESVGWVVCPGGGEARQAVGGGGGEGRPGLCLQN